jgi:hypothetical protein
LQALPSEGEPSLKTLLASTAIAIIVFKRAVAGCGGGIREVGRASPQCVK